MCDVDESEWTRENLHKLCVSLKTSIPEKDKCSIYTKGLKAVDWNMVAFHPFSPEACLEKWTEILQRMRKMRTLTELVDEAEDALSHPVSDSNVRKIYPDLPKRPSPPNALFYEENRAKYQEKHPKMSSQKILRVLNKKFKKLSAEEKSLYVEKYELASEEHTTKMQEFRKKHHLPPMPQRRCKRKKMSEGNTHDEEDFENKAGFPPKPPVNGYNLFCKDQAGSIECDTGKNNITLWAQRWRDLTENQRDNYKERCKKLRNEFSVKLDEYLKAFDAETQKQILEKHCVKRPKEINTVNNRVRTFTGEPKMPSLAGNTYFLQDQMVLLKEESSCSKMSLKRIHQMWKELPTQEKNRYKRKAADNMRSYQKELKKWFQKLTPAEQKEYLLHKPSKKKTLEGVKPVPCQEDPSHKPSDSEDEQIEISSSDEDEIILEGEELEGGLDDIPFELF